MCETSQTKSSFYQMILLNDSNITATNNNLKLNNLKCESLAVSRNGNKFFIIQAPQNLGYILRDVKNIVLYNYSNEGLCRNPF